MTESQDPFVGTFYVPQNDGTNPYYVNLSNESHTLLVDATGLPLDGELLRAFTYVTAGMGQTQYKFTTNAIPAKEEFTLIEVLPTGKGWTADVHSDSSIAIAGVQLNAAAACSVYFKVLFNDGTLIHKTFSIDKKSGLGAIGAALR